MTIMKKNIFLVSGARPNFMKIAPLWKEIVKFPKNFNPILIHTGQHYDYKMSDVFFKEFNLPEININFNVGTGSYAEQTAKIILAFEKACNSYKPDLVIVVGDVNSTLAVSIVASKINLPIAHVEAGLRSFDRTMPEEINRTVTDSISDMHFTTCKDANDNLKNEGIPKEKIFLVGNVMIDTLKHFLKKSLELEAYKNHGLNKKEYSLLTMHRPSNVDNKETLEKVLKSIEIISKDIKIIFPVHPRTKDQINFFNLNKYFSERFKLIEPIGYLESLNLMSNSKFVLTDSGGIQEETTFLGIPCLTLRENTERPITIKQGTNCLVGSDTDKIICQTKKILNDDYKKGAIPELWDGKAAERIVRIIKKGF